MINKNIQKSNLILYVQTLDKKPRKTQTRNLLSKNQKNDIFFYSQAAADLWDTGSP